MTQQQIFTFILIVLPFVLTGIVAPVATYFIGKLPAAQQPRALQIVNEAVQAVEQISTSNTANLDSTAKKNLALQFATSTLKSWGISLDPQIISTLIESAVFVMNNKATPVAVLPAVAATTQNTASQTSGSPLVPATSITSPSQSSQAQTAQPVYGPVNTNATNTQPSTDGVQTPIPAFTSTAEIAAVNTPKQ